MCRSTLNLLPVFFLVVYLNCVFVSCGHGTTANIKSIFLGRCFELLELKSTQESPVLKGKNCSLLYNRFAAVFDKNTTCQTNYSGAFDNFFKEINQGPTPTDKALFWSGTKNVAHSISYLNSEFITLEDTLPGFVINDLNFCGEGRIGFNYDNCSCAWANSQIKQFWTSASAQFAKNARGSISVLVNGTRKDGNPAFRLSSTFAEVELPNLDASLVKQVTIFVGMDLNEKRKERCGTGSIKVMQNLIRKRNIDVKCIDEPRTVFHVLCVKYPTTQGCQKMMDEEKEFKMWKIMGLTFASLSVALLAVLVIVLWRRKARTGHSIMM